MSEGAESEPFVTHHTGISTEDESFETVEKRKMSFSVLNLADTIDGSDVGNFLGIDIGGTLTKVVFFQPDNLPNTANTIADFVLGASKYGSTGERDLHLSFKSGRLKGTLHFIRFHTSRAMGAMELFSGREEYIDVVQATGGGAVKFKETVKEKLDITLAIHNEFRTLVRGLTFTLLEHPDTECFTYTDPLSKMHEDAKHKSRPRLGSEASDFIRESRRLEDLFPFLVVNIGSGVSVLKVRSPNDFERVTGTPLGGATFLGLCKLLTGCADFDVAMRLAEKGEGSSVNLLVEDIYGGPLIIPTPEGSFTLKGTHVASFFGKLCRSQSVLTLREDLQIDSLLGLSTTEVILLLGVALCAVVSSRLEGLGLLLALFLLPFLYWVLRQVKASQKGSSRREVLSEDVANALVVMLAQNITQIAFMSAETHGVQRVIFTGSFLRGSEVAQVTLTRNMKLWSGGKVEALFTSHEGYFGALGAFLGSCEL